MDTTERLRRAIAAISARDPTLGREMDDVRRRHEQQETPQRAALESLGTTPPSALETIVLATGRPVLAVVNDDTRLDDLARADPESAVWRQRLEQARDRIVPALRAVGRVDVQGHDRFSWLGTGWIVGEQVIVTNRHVAREFARSDGEGFVFRQGPLGGAMGASIDFLHEVGSAATRTRGVARVLHVEPEPGPDVAFLQLSDGSSPVEAIDLTVPRAGSKNAFVAVIGYPARDSRVPDQELMERIFGNVYDHKRLAPGMVTGSAGEALQHDCSTLGGNSGSVVLDLESGCALALHFSGAFLQANYAVPAATVRRLYEQRVLRKSAAVHVDAARSSGRASQRDSPASVDLVIPVRLRIEVGVPTGEPMQTASSGEQDVLDKVEEGRKEDYSGRGGYDDNFLGATLAVPLPQVLADGDVLRFTVDGKKESVLRYQHFSVVMSKARRMCHYSAVNIDGSRPRKVERGAWRLDPRIRREQQIIEECYGSPPRFSRGHMTRREDPVWGPPDVARQGNSDSMHVTNVTPQMQSFNAPIWLGLEDYALGHAREDGMRLCVFTGPFFRDDDPTMYGVRIPRSFWKVIAFVHDQTKKLCATGYRISQAAELPEQEYVFGEFEASTGPAQVSLAQIERDAGVSFGALTALDPKARTPEGLESTEPQPPSPLRSFADIVFV